MAEVWLLTPVRGVRESADQQVGAQHAASHSSPSLSSAHKAPVCLGLGDRGEEKALTKNPALFLSLSLSHRNTHQQTHLPRRWRVPQSRGSLGAPNRVSLYTTPALTEPLQELPPLEGRPDSPSELPCWPGTWGPGTLRYCCPCLGPWPPLATARGLSRRGEPGSSGISVRGKDRRQSNFR